MKKTLSIFLALAVITRVAFANAETPTSTSGLAVTKNGSTFKIFYKGTSTSDIKVVIYNDKSQVVFKEVFKNTDGFIRPYNLSSLPKGDYKIEIADASGKQVETLNHREIKTNKFGHVISMASENDKYLLSVANKGKDVLSIKVLDKYSKILFEHTENIDGDYARIYNLQALKEKHMLEVSDNSGIITSYKF